MKTGINTDKISGLCLEIQDYADKIKNVLNQIESVVDNLDTNFQGDGALEFKNKFLNLREYYPIIYENITSYIDEFNTLTLKYGINDIDVSNLIKNSAEKIINIEGGNNNGL